MNTRRFSKISLLAILGLSPFLVAASALVQDELADATKQAELTLADVRAAVIETYDRWGSGRVEYDKEAMDSILAPDFYVSLYGEKLSREEFLGSVSVARPGSSLTRFDVDVLTVRKSEEGWTAVIAEKVEFLIPGSDGKQEKVCSYWVTRDGFARQGDDWVITFSEAIGHENWAPGVMPPINDW